LRTAVTKAKCLKREMHKLDASYNLEVRDLMMLLHPSVFSDQTGKETRTNVNYCFSAVHMADAFDTPESVPEAKKGIMGRADCKRSNKFYQLRKCWNEVPKKVPRQMKRKIMKAKRMLFKRDHGASIEICFTTRTCSKGFLWDYVLNVFGNSSV
jgi:hypothetical protein